MTAGPQSSGNSAGTAAPPSARSSSNAHPGWFSCSASRRRPAGAGGRGGRPPPACSTTATPTPAPTPTGPSGPNPPAALPNAGRGGPVGRPSTATNASITPTINATATNAATTTATGPAPGDQGREARLSPAARRPRWPCTTTTSTTSSGKLRYPAGHLWHGGRTLDRTLATLWREATQVAETLGFGPDLHVYPVLCVHVARMPWLRELLVDGIPVLDAAALRPALQVIRQALTPEQVALVAGQVRAGFRPVA
jgi:hypothetical protein